MPESLRDSVEPFALRPISPMGWWTESRYDSVCPRSGHLAYAGSLAHERIRSPDAALGDRLVAARPVLPYLVDGVALRLLLPAQRAPWVWPVFGTRKNPVAWRCARQQTGRSATSPTLFWWTESRCDVACPI